MYILWFVDQTHLLVTSGLTGDHTAFSRTLKTYLF